MKAKEWIFYLPFISLQFLFLTLSVPSLAQDDEKEEDGEEDLKVNTVVIDPGHGGKDPGAIGHSKVKEKDIVLDIALKLGDRIKEHYGEEVEIIYTRKTDKFVELHERGRIANENDADLFISLHANVVGNSNVKGCETFVLGLHRSKANLEVAKKENSAILMEDDHERHYGDFDPKDPDSYIALELMQSEFLEQSLQFAAKAQKQFDKKVGRSNRGVKQAGFLVLYRTTMPSVLHELGFISNPDEEDFLNSKEGKRKMANGLFRAFKTYKKSIDQRNSFDKKLASDSVQERSFGKKEESKEIVEKELNEKAVSFRVQIAASKKKRKTVPENFKGLSNVETYLSEDSTYKYVVGRTGSYEEAEKLEKQVQGSGYPGAFIIAFKEGERIEMEKAMELAKRSEDR